MASHRQNLARQTLKRFFGGDPNPNPYTEVEELHPLINDAVSEGKPAQIEACRRWIATHAMGNPQWLNAVGKYLVELSNAYGFVTKETTTDQEAMAKTAPTERQPSTERKRIHVLYILNDLLHHAKHGLSDTVAADHTKSYGKPFFDAFITCLRPTIVDLVRAASSCDSTKFFGHHERIRNQLTIWEVEHYFDGAGDKMYKDLRVIEASEGRTVPYGAKDGRLPVSREQNETNVEDVANISKPEKANRWEYPAVHGQTDLQFWHCQPAATMIAHVRIDDQKRRIFIRKRNFGPAKMKKGPIEPRVISVVTDLIKAKKELYNFSISGEPGIQYDINNMGERCVVAGFKTDKKSGKIVRIIKETNYYGFSLPFARRVRKHRKEADEKKNMSSGSRSPAVYSTRRSSTRTPSTRSPTPAALQQNPAPQHQLPSFVPPPHGAQFPLPPPPFPPPPPPQNWRGPWPPPPPNVNFGAFGTQYGGGWAPPIPQPPPMGPRGTFHGGSRGGVGNRGAFRGNNRGGVGSNFRGSNRGNFRGNPY